MIRKTWWEWCGVAFCAAAFLLLRLPLYTQPGILLGWHSDAALLGLMARAIVAGDYPLLFWGSDYLAPLTSLFAAALGTTPLALRLGVAIEVFAALAFFHAALRRVVTPAASLLAMFWLVAGPAFLFKLTYAPLSAEQYFFVGAVAFWYVARAPFTRLHQWLVLGLLAGAGWWIHRGVMFVIVPALAVILCYDARLLRRAEVALSAFVFACGAALGYVPALLGRFGIDQRLYEPLKAPWRLERVGERLVDTVTYDLWALLGAERSWLLAVLLIVLIALCRFPLRRESVLALTIVATAFAFWILSSEPYRGAVRYIMIALPILYAFAAQGIVRVWQRSRLAGIVLAIVVAAMLFVPRFDDVREIVAAHRERYEQFPGGFDPRPALRTVDEGHYTVCYANVWIAHKLEFLGDSGVRFIPYRSVNRRMVESLRLGALPGRKCLVDLQGNVRTLQPSEEMIFRRETLRLARP